MQMEMLLPNMQLVANYTQDGSDAVYVGNADAVALQFFANNLESDSVVVFTVQHSTSKSDNQFIDSSETATLNGSSGVSLSAINVIDYNEIAGFIKIKVAVTLGAADAVDVRVQMNLKQM